MFKSLNLENLKKSNQLVLLSIDFFMLFLVSINLLWLIWDTLFGVGVINQFLKTNALWLHSGYTPVHENFLLIDLVFVGIFLSEFFLRWIISVRQKEYLRWYFFPFAHWYDLIGCIPVGPYRFLRFLRIFSICYRLQKHKIVDFSNWPIFRFFIFYYNVFLEELSDRVVINVLNGTSKEVEKGSPFFKNVVDEILLPRRQLLIDWLSTHIEEKSSQLIDDRRDDIKLYVDSVVSKAVENNKDIERLNRTPVIGEAITSTLNDTITDIVYHTIENILYDLSSSQNKSMVEELASLLMSSSHQETLTDEHVRKLIIEIIEAIKTQVAIQHWKEELRD